MKKVTLLGDSIRLGYGQKVPALLQGEYAVFQPEDNCRFAKYTLRGLFEWREQIEGSDVIHWNNGMWDVSDLFGDGYFSPLEEYRANIKRIAELLLKITPKVIFATTTPVRDGYMYQTNDDIRLFNDTVTPMLSDMGVVINDLFQTVYPQRIAYIREDDKLHLNDAGIDICANQVANCIRKVSC